LVRIILRLGLQIRDWFWRNKARHRASQRRSQENGK
jgi:hypothetical protein